MVLTAAAGASTARSILQDLAAAERSCSTPAGPPPLRQHRMLHLLSLAARSSSTLSGSLPRSRVVVEATHHPLTALLDGQLDIGIVANPLKHKRLDFHPLFEDELVVILHPDHPLASSKFVRPEDFSDQHFLLYAIPPKQSTVLQKILVPAGVTPRKVTHVPLTEAILEMVRAGIGIAVFARWAVAPLLATGELRAVRLTRWGVRRSWFAAVRRNRQRPPYVDAFVSLLQKHPISKSIFARRPAQLRKSTLLQKI
jgi:DNA-binding transcriptional LysR family regulator